MKLRINNIQSWLYAWLLVCLTACSSSSITEGLAESTPISFGSKLSRAAVETDKQNMQSFSVWSWRKSIQNNVQPVFQATEIQPTGSYSNVQYWIPGHHYDFFALHPHHLNVSTATATCTEQGVLTLTNFDTSNGQGVQAVDLMTASMLGCDGSNPTGPVQLTFQHELCRVSFEVFESDPHGEVEVKDAKLYGIVYKGTFQKEHSPQHPASRWSWTPQDVCTETQSLFEGTQSILIQDNPQKPTILLGELLLIPQNFKQLGPAYFDFSYKKKNESSYSKMHMPIWNPLYPSWEKGKQYRYIAEITHTGKIHPHLIVSSWSEHSLHVDW